MKQSGPFELLVKECEEKSDLKAGLLNKESKNWDIWEGLSLEGRQHENLNHRRLTKLTTWTTTFSNSMKL